VINLTHGTYLSPVLVAAHLKGDGSFPGPGATASPSIRKLAESGDVTDFQTDILNDNPSAVTQILNGSAHTKVAPGESVSTVISTGSNDRLTVVAKLLPTNDGFTALNSIDIPTNSGVYYYGLNALDAGTEANDELVVPNGDTVGVQGIGPDSDITTGINGTNTVGPDTNTMVHVHRGVLGDNDPSGGRSDLDSTTQRWLNPVARVVIEVP